MPPKTTTQNHDPDLDELPGFAGTTAEEAPAVGLPDELPDDGLPDDELLEPESPPASPAPSTTSPSPSSSASGPESPSAPSPPTATSTDEPDPELTDPELTDPELTDGLEYLAGGLFQLVGHFLNRMATVRRRQRTTLWMVTEDEADRFAAPIARIAERRLPDELKSGDAADVVIAGAVAIDYAAHNAAGVPGVAMPEVYAQNAQPNAQPAQEQPAPAPAPAPPPSAEQPQAPVEGMPLVAPDL